tara:strand:+ start:4104 stop:4583 length:480 start_codon:yes stop_codon:yes gene_type:complete
MFSTKENRTASVFLKKIEKLLSKYSKPIEQKQFNEIDRMDGPGMGALVSHSNSLLTWKIINDRNQLFIEIHPNHTPKESFGLAFLISMIKLFSTGRHFVELTKTEKIELFKIKTDFNDPLRSFFKYYDDLNFILSEEHYSRTKNELNDFLKERGKWMFQ